MNGVRTTGRAAAAVALLALAACGKKDDATQAKAIHLKWQPRSFKVFRGLLVSITAIISAGVATVAMR